MRNLFINFENGVRRANWPAIIGFSIATFMSTIAAAETFWKLFTGGFSALIALYAFFTATLIVIRAIGASMADPFLSNETGFRSPWYVGRP